MGEAEDRHALVIEPSLQSHMTNMMANTERYFKGQRDPSVPGRSSTCDIVSSRKRWREPWKPAGVLVVVYVLVLLLFSLLLPY